LKSFSLNLLFIVCISGLHADDEIFAANFIFSMLLVIFS